MGYDIHTQKPMTNGPVHIIPVNYSCWDNENLSLVNMHYIFFPDSLEHFPDVCFENLDDRKNGVKEGKGENWADPKVRSAHSFSIDPYLNKRSSDMKNCSDSTRLFG